MARRRREETPGGQIENRSTFEEIRSRVMDEISDTFPTSLTDTAFNNAFGDLQSQLGSDFAIPDFNGLAQLEDGMMDSIRLRNNGMFIANGSEEIQSFGGGGGSPGQILEYSGNTMAPMATTTVANQGGIRQRMREEMARSSNATEQMAAVSARSNRSRLVAAYSVTDLAWALYHLERTNGDLEFDDVERVLSVWGYGGYQRPWEGGFIVKLHNGKVAHLRCTVGTTPEPWPTGDFQVRYEEGQHVLDLDIPADVNLKEDPSDLNRWLRDPNREPIAYDTDG